MKSLKGVLKTVKSDTLYAQAIIYHEEEDLSLDTNGYIGALDQGTTSTRFILFNFDGEQAGSHQVEHRQYYPKPGWVEHEPMEIWEKSRLVISETLRRTGITGTSLAAIGITNQRETTVVWNPKTGEPYGNAIVWQDARTSSIINTLCSNGGIDRFREKTGLPLSTYFSASKLKWLLDHTEGLRAKAEGGEALFGTIDSWLVWWLTGGPKGGVHSIDVTNASRTMLMNIHTLAWDDELLEAFGVPRRMLPEITASVPSQPYGYTKKDSVFGAAVAVSGALGDQQAALFGQACFEVGGSKNTYGTGCFLLLNTGERAIRSKHGLLTTVGYKIGEHPVTYAMEGSIAMAGSLVQWIRDNLGLISESSEIETLAKSVPDTGDIYFVPAFSGLFAPYWRTDARGVIVGLSGHTTKGHIARAVLEATAFQTLEMFDAMEKDSGIGIEFLRADGGMVGNELLMQFQADMLEVPVVRPVCTETTAFGAAFAAGLSVGFWDDLPTLRSLCKEEKRWFPNLRKEERERRYGRWKKAVTRSFDWVED